MLRSQSTQVRQKEGCSVALGVWSPGCSSSLRENKIFLLLLPGVIAQENGGWEPVRAGPLSWFPPGGRKAWKIGTLGRTHVGAAAGVEGRVWAGQGPASVLVL